MSGGLVTAAFALPPLPPLPRWDVPLEESLKMSAAREAHMKDLDWEQKAGYKRIGEVDGNGVCIFVVSPDAVRRVVNRARAAGVEVEQDDFEIIVGFRYHFWLAAPWERAWPFWEKQPNLWKFSINGGRVV